MDFVTGMKRKQVIMQSQMGDVSANQNIVMEGAIHNLRDMSDFVFIILRTYEGLVQCVASKKESYQTLREGMTVKVTGEVREEQRAPGGYELVVKQIEILSKPVEGSRMPVSISKWRLNTSLEAKLEYRPIALRNIRERSIFKIQEGIARGFRDFMFSQHFTEVRTPKIVAGNA